MNAQNAHLFLPLVQALADGKTIQGFSADAQKWCDLTAPAFDNWGPDKFRIKPEPPKPLECWCYVSMNGSMQAGAMTIEKPTNERYFLFREVLTETP